MNAPKSAVNQIIKSFNGEEEIGGSGGWLVTFRNQEVTERVIKLVEMLNGWKATEHPNILHMVRIHGLTEDLPETEEVTLVKL